MSLLCKHISSRITLNIPALGYGLRQHVSQNPKQDTENFLIVSLTLEPIIERLEPSLQGLSASTSFNRATFSLYQLWNSPCCCSITDCFPKKDFVGLFKEWESTYCYGSLAVCSLSYFNVCQSAAFGSPKFSITVSSGYRTTSRREAWTSYRMFLWWWCRSLSFGIYNYLQSASWVSWLSSSSAGCESYLQRCTVFFKAYTSGSWSLRREFVPHHCVASSQTRWHHMYVWSSTAHF